MVPEAGEGHLPNAPTAAGGDTVTHTPWPSPLPFDSDGHGQDIVVLYGRVVVDDDHPVIQDWPPYLEKYGPAVERIFGSIAKFSQSYPIALRVTITGVRGFYVRG